MQPLDLLSDEFAEGFDQVTSELTERCPVAMTNTGWLLSRHEDVRAAANDWETFSSADGIHPFVPSNKFRPTEIDPPQHRDFKQPFLRLFAARAVGVLEPRIREHARSLIAEFRSRGRCEIGTDYSRRLVGDVFFQELLELDAAYGQEVLDLIYRWVVPPFDVEAMEEYENHIDAILRSKADAPTRPPMIDALLSLEVDGQPASWRDKCMTLNLLIVGGLDTTVHGINSTITFLATHPEVLAELRADPALVPAAVEESLRMFSPLFVVGRTARKDVEMHGVPVKEGDRVLLAWGASSRDPRVFDEPGTFDLHRSAQPHLAFGSGVHRCLGSHVARVEMRVAIEEFISAIPHFELAPGTEPQWHTGMARGVSEAHLVFGS